MRVTRNKETSLFSITATESTHNHDPTEELIDLPTIRRHERKAFKREIRTHFNYGITTKQST